MKHLKFGLLLFLLCAVSSVMAQYDVKANYDKQEVAIEMRDGVKLHTTIYTPKDKTKAYPILMQRTPYSSRPYGEDQYRRQIGPNKFLMEQGNIIVYQDVRGRWMSGGTYDNMRAYIPNKTGKQSDEASDTYDTIDWLVNNVENNNGNVGTWGISYPGHYAAMSVLSDHPALKAASPQAPIGDFYFDDFHHNGAYLLSYWIATSVFGYDKEGPVTEAWYSVPDIGTRDAYQFFLDIGPLKNLDKYYGEDNVFWQQLKDHPDYDEFWQKRGLVQHMKNVKPAVLTVGGLFDAEDLYGPFEIYKSLEKNSDNYNALVFGPWSHGDWARLKKRQAVGNIFFGDNLSENFQLDYETEFFNHFLKGEKEFDIPEASVYDTGAMEWNAYDMWPPENATATDFYLVDNQNLSMEPKPDFENKFVSDITKPVPFTEDIKVTFTPRKFMTDDQRFAARRPDVMVYETEVLQEDMKLSGEIMAALEVATTGTAADWIVKVIDVYPADAEDSEEMQDHLRMSNYHMMVRSEVFRGRYRESFSDPKPFVPGKKTSVDFALQDINHTFKKGHKLQIQVQSTFFPYIDRNPQKYVDNIFEADEEDFETHTHTIYGDSKIVLPVVK
ncbi:CocE/NonD family hydrolase [Psychroflexus sp. YR1-1]|uniref:CocE/NonD family hydrolase n=1 Tax=Psychroflexus aurantiacus TaxID=2709310 RepID=A0A6B3R272_9FLAO|nr:CocE/NonD family hydrolase [Psychroflexus aurantiacus]NEV94148.1 CocE/NonD family hydrolase [Psychroflexus aurantiacus]